MDFRQRREATATRLPPVAHIEAESAFFIGRVQGVCRDAELVRRVTRELGDISPRDLLWSALEGTGSVLHIAHALGGARTPRGWYRLSLPVQGKPLAEIPQKHRRRTERKRQAKSAVRQAVAESFRREIMRACGDTLSPRASAVS